MSAEIAHDFTVNPDSGMLGNLCLFFHLKGEKKRTLEIIWE